MNRDSSRSVESSAALRRLLSSHYSVYNTLTDPLLECALPVPLRQLPHSLSKEVTLSRCQDPPEHDNETALQLCQKPEFLAAALEDSLASFLSWQSIHMSSFHDLARLIRIASPFTCNNFRSASASILSNSSDEEASLDSLVFAPSLKKQVSPKVLLFETDEEDNADDDVASMKTRGVITLELDKNRPTRSQRRVSVQTDLLQTFIMPRMSLSDEIIKLQLTIISSASDFMEGEIEFLTDFVQKHLSSASTRLSISQIPLERSPMQEEISLAQKSDVLLAVNDGCEWIPALVGSVASSQTDSNALPMLVVVNLLTSNYFASLFDIIRYLRPHQNIKCASLRNKDILVKIQGIIGKELFKGKCLSHSMPNQDKNSLEDVSFSDERFSLCKSWSASIEKPNYRLMERNIRSRIKFSEEYSIVDPLYVSSNLSHLSALINSLSELLVGESIENRVHNLSLVNRETLWLLCSFSVGIGLGLSLNALHVFEKLKCTLFLNTRSSFQPVLKTTSKEFYLRTLDIKVSGCVHRMMSCVNDALTAVINFCTNFELWSEPGFGKVSQTCKALCDIIFESAVSGFGKLTSVARVWLE